jgi:excisionase family DNA binding protein
LKSRGAEDFYRFFEERLSASGASQQSAQRWLSIRRACDILGVNPATLRQWTAEGKVRAYVTPGGHRRYPEDVLLAMVERPAAVTAPPPPIFASHDQYVAVRRQLEAAPWFQSLDASALQQYRILGNSMLHLVGSYAMAPSEAERDTSLTQGREVASAHAAAALSAGLSVRDAMEAFLVFRAPIIDTLAEWSRLRAAESEHLAAMLKRVCLFMDEMLLAMVSAYESLRPRRDAR